MKITANFDSTEFDCKCGCDMPEDVLDNIKLLALELQKIRDYYNRSVRINSGYRCETYNKKIGGVKNSQHILGKAADIVVQDTEAFEVYDDVLYMIKTCGLDIGGLGKYETFTHVDIRNSEKLITWGN
jgi:uncharacterized protein YcbK (DUF882 family)